MMLAALALIVAGCAPLPQYTSLRVEQRPSPNFSERRPNFVILHHTSGHSTARALSTLADPASEVSAHYLIARDGKIYYLVDELKRAWHAGASYWGGNRDLNSASIGIELDNSGVEPYAEAQIAALLELLADLQARHGIPTANFLGHGDVAPGRKVDPGAQFPWRRLAEHGFGVWCEPPDGVTSAAAAPGADGITLLSAFGYDVENSPAAVAAFRRHFGLSAAAEQTPELTGQELALLQCLLARRHGP
ncbi:MAG: N-acetylmuramoyl-L-alanine amidase [Pseudomonadota bacterium]